MGDVKQFPDQKIKHDDESNIRVAVFTDDNQVILQFEKPIGWLGLSKAQVIALAHVLLKNANELTN